MVQNMSDNKYNLKHNKVINIAKAEWLKVYIKLNHISSHILKADKN